MELSKFHCWKNAIVSKASFYLPVHGFKGAETHLPSISWRDGRILTLHEPLTLGIEAHIKTICHRKVLKGPIDDRVQVQSLHIAFKELSFEL